MSPRCRVIQGSFSRLTASSPGLAKPTELSIPPRNSATRGAGFPLRGSKVTDLVTSPPTWAGEIVATTGSPKPAVPAASMTGLANRAPKRRSSLTWLP